jgi:hypothetical protein
MPNKIDIRFTPGKSHLGGIIITAHSVDEKTNHGAPDTLQLVQGALPDVHYWEVAKKLKQSLDQTPDYANVRSAEVKTTVGSGSFSDPKGIEQDWNYPNTRGRHNLSGGQHATIDTIRRDNIATVAAKSLRELKAMGAIDEVDYKSGLSRIAMAGIGEIRPPEQDPKYRAGAENIPSHKANGYGMGRATADYLETKPPSPKPEISIIASRRVAI